MNLATIQVSGVHANVVTMCGRIPAGIVGATVELQYDGDVWAGLRKTVVFKGRVTKDVISDSGTVTVPAEVVAETGCRLRVGIYGTDADNNIVVPTLWADLGTVSAAADPSGDTTTDPALPVWAQLQAAIGNLNNLDTQAKSSIVAAINELTAKGGNVDPAAVQKIVIDYLVAHPPTVAETDPTVPAWAKEPRKPSYTADEVGALAQSDLQTGIDQALAQAKASGEFDGKDGYTPQKGIDYFDGKDGYTPVKGVDYFDGLPGYTPQKGVDYFDGDDYVLTDADKAEIANSVLTLLPKWTGGSY